METFQKIVYFTFGECAISLKKRGNITGFIRPMRNARALKITLCMPLRQGKTGNIFVQFAVQQCCVAI